MAAGLDVAVRAAAAHGFLLDEPVVLQDTNNVVVWLRPHEVIVKVGTYGHSRQALTSEHSVAKYLADQGAAVAPPVHGLAPYTDLATGSVVTFWDRVATDPNAHLTPPQIGESLRRLHTDLDSYPGHLPDFRYALDLAGAALNDDQLMAALATGDRAFLQTAFRRLSDQLGEWKLELRPLHGEPHSANRLLTADGGLRWIDFEAACQGPLEWDLASVDSKIAEEFPEADATLLAHLRLLNSARVAIWCWAKADVASMRLHGEHHLALVRTGLLTR
jgi:Ser/Thr protein kinase RdoA (MazF antagonist)